MSFDHQFNPWVFELGRYTGWGVVSPSSPLVQARFRHDRLPFALGAECTRQRFSSIDDS